MSKENIPGIHNYCDRWCERCTFTSRCSVFTDFGDLSPEEQDLRNKAFWERLSHNFSRAKNLLTQAAERYGIDLNALQEDADQSELKQEEIRTKSENHPLGKLTLEYSELTKAWLETQPGMIEKLVALRDQLELGEQGQQDAKEQTATIKDSLAIIEWYETFVHAKFMRALMGKFDDTFHEVHEFDAYQRDYDGSAKIGIIAVDRCMQAWSRLYELMPQEEDEFLKILVRLEKIKSIALNEFPKAMAFIRPGFDEHL